MPTEPPMGTIVFCWYRIAPNVRGACYCIVIYCIAGFCVKTQVLLSAPAVLRENSSMQQGPVLVVAAMHELPHATALKCSCEEIHSADEIDGKYVLREDSEPSRS